MGWLGYTAREALDANVNHVTAALKARSDLLNALFSTEKPEDKTPKRRPMTPDRFSAIATAKDRARARGK